MVDINLPPVLSSGLYIPQLMERLGTTYGLKVTAFEADHCIPALAICSKRGLSGNSGEASKLLLTARRFEGKPNPGAADVISGSNNV